MLYTELFADDIKQMFKDFGRDYFSYEACEALVEFFEDDTVEFDPIAICCDFHEASPAEIMNDYDCIHADLVTDEWNNLDTDAFILELSRFTWCQFLDNDKVLYQLF